jgi:hypothetical protein
MLDSIVQNILSFDWSVLVLVGAILLLATELGYRLGQRHTPERRKALQGQSGTLQASLLGLLGLLLGFTFAMAVGRFESRKQLVLDEANGIGTAWLRAGYLSESTRDVIRPTLLDYVDARLQAANVPVGSEEYEKQVARSERNQATMWRATTAEVKAHDSPAVSLFTASLNDVIDLDAKRQATTRNHVPASVWLLLILVSVVVCWTTGYSTALSESGRLALSMIILPVLLTAVITIVADLDNPRRGLIKVSQQSMLDLQNALQRYE